MKSLRTYRLLRFIVAATLVLGVMLPLVRYACAMNGLAMTGPSAALSICAKQDAGTMAEAEACPASTTLCPEDAPCPSAEGCAAQGGDEASCCTAETVQAEKTLVMESKPAHVLLPVVAFLKAVETVSPLSSYLSLAHELHGDSGGGVPLRVLHASFLL